MEIKVATTMDELREIGALRYNVFVREQRISAFFADATAELFIEPVDAFNESTIVYARENAGIVASIRVEHRIPDWLLRQLGKIPGGFFSLKCCYLSKALSTDVVRGMRYFDKLSLWLAENITIKNYELALLVCKHEFVSLYLKYAFQPSKHLAKFPDDHPDDRPNQVMALLACSDGVRGTRLRSMAGRFQHELSMERKAELYRWLKL